MYNENNTAQQDEKLAYLKQEAYAAANHIRATQAELKGMAGCDVNATGRPSLRDRVSSDLRCAIDQSRKAEQLRELSFLLDKNPEVARILDLMEIVRG